MKVRILFSAIFAVLAFSIPLLALFYAEPEAEPVPHSPISGILPQNVPASAPAQSSAPAAGTPPAGPDIPEAEPSGPYSDYGVLRFRILDRSTGKINEVSVRDYVRGAVASEMPAAFHPEALKAQAVAAHTYALYNHYLQQRSPDPALSGADFSADPSKREGYMTERAAREFYGDMADFYWDKVCGAVDSVLPYIMEYEGEPIVAAYHAISAGKTEDAGNVWNGGAPYLVPADSAGCLLAPDYETKTAMTAEVVRETLLAAYPKMELSGDPREWFGAVTRSESGYITGIEVGDVPLHGKIIRELFGLRSHNLDIVCDGSTFSFTAYGHGHGVGLSQYGADFLARQGYSFDQILENYYASVVLRQVDFEGLAG